MEYQYDDLQPALRAPCPVADRRDPLRCGITVTLPITEFYNPDDCQRNEEKIEKKRRNLMQAISLNKGESCSTSSAWR